MLRVYFGNKEDTLVQISGYFDNVYEDDWIESDLGKIIIKEVDNSDVIHSHVIESPVLGPITPRELSGGAKGLILMAFDNDMLGRYFYGEQFGGNTTRLMLDIADMRDIHITLNHILEFPSNDTFEIMIDNSNKIVTNYKDYVEEYLKYRQ